MLFLFLMLGINSSVAEQPVNIVHTNIDSPSLELILNKKMLATVLRMRKSVHKRIMHFEISTLK